MPTLRETDLESARHLPLAHVATPTARRSDADQIDRAVADVVIAVAPEFLGRESPIAGDEPFLNAADDFAAALAAVPAVERQVEIAAEIAEILEGGWRRWIPGGPDRPLVAGELRDLGQTPLRTIQGRVIRLAEKWHTDETAIGAVAPAMIRAGKDRRVAFVITAHLHAAMSARIQKDMHLAGAVAAQDHRLLAHPRRRVIAGVRDLALMADEEPGAREDPLLLLGVDRLVDKDLAADLPGLRIDQTRAVSGFTCRRHAYLPIHHRGTEDTEMIVSLLNLCALCALW